MKEDHPEQFTESQRQETKAWLRTSDKRAEEQAAQKAAMLGRIRTLRQKLAREARRKGCSAQRMKDIEGELQDLNELERQECGTGEPKHPSARPLANELGFKDTPSATEILEAATIQRGLRFEKAASDIRQAG